MIKSSDNIKSGTTIWITGLSGSGKTTIASLLSASLRANGCVVIFMDGDLIRASVNRDLGFSQADRKENVRRVAEIAKIMNVSGVHVVVALISPTNESRQLAKEIIGNKNFRLVFVDTPIKTCIKRDVKGLYKKALQGEIDNFTGINSSYEKPADADLVIEDYNLAPEKAVDVILDHFKL